MKPSGARSSIVLALLLAGFAVVQAQMRDYRTNMDLLRLLGDKPWPMNDPHDRWDRSPKVIDPDDPGHELPMDDESTYQDYDFRLDSDKRSGLATALNYGRRRREPTQTLGKVITTNRGGLMNNMGSFFDNLRGGLEDMAYVPPQRIYQEAPDVIEAPSGTGSGGSGTRNMHTLRPLRPAYHIRSYKRRSYEEAGDYPNANRHNPELLWTGLGKR